MFTETPLSTQLRAQQNDRLRVLVVGAGPAGLTLTQLLRQQGLHPVLVDRMPTAQHPGYMLALMPTVDAAIADLGLRDRYLAAGTPFSRYRYRSHRGRILRTDPIGPLLGEYGDYQGISRGAFIDVLTADGCAVTWNATIDDASPAGNGRTAVRFVDAAGVPTASAEFDLVVGADGIHSAMRDVLGGAAPETVRTGWSGWIAWIDDLPEPDLGEELWGDRFFLGVYPVRDRFGVFFGGPDAEIAAGPAAFVTSVRGRVDDVGPRLSACLDVIADSEEPYLWRLDDARSPRWVLPHGVLLGDAAAGFLPTAGVGAGMAVEAAWMLGRVLDGADAGNLETVLARWEEVERPRVERAQSNSRTLARLMFRGGRMMMWMRETVMKLLSVRAAIRPILRLVAERPDPNV